MTNLFKALYTLSVSCVIWTAAAATAQTVNPYERLVDPLAIARIDNPDFGPERGDGGYGFGYARDTANPGYFIVAQDTGSGIITHLFMTTWTPDSETRFKLFIGGNLVRDATMNNFFDSLDGFFRNPFDTIACVARLSDVQVPYQHGFKLSYKTPDYTTWYAYAWRPVPWGTNLPFAQDVQSSLLAQEESRAVEVYRNPSLLWEGTSATDTSYAATIPPGRDTTLLWLTGSNIVKTFSLLPSEYDQALDSIWLEVYWDGAAAPAISTPLLALFGQCFDFRDLHSVAMDFTKDSGLNLHLPMPFTTSMRIAFNNKSSKDITVHGRVSYFPYQVDRTQFGYLHAQFNAIHPTRYGVPFHALHVKGRGRYVGLLMGIPGLTAVQTYEGHPEFRSDSSDWYSFYYEGTEDYFDGAEYFACGDFSMPFGGTSNSSANYYRFHYMDAFDFRKAFDFDLVHGIGNDAHEYYRGLTFWYQQNIQYWPDRDTVRSGEKWHVSGAAYKAGEAITIMMDSTVVDEFQASEAGAFDRSISVAAVPFGAHYLRVNDEVWPEAILITRSATLCLLNEPSPIRLQVGDTVLFGGEGFSVGDSLHVKVGGTPVTARCTIDSSHRMHGWAVLPEDPEGDYAVAVDGPNTGLAISSETLHLTPILTLECEDLWDSSASLPGRSRYLNLVSLLRGGWSQDAVLDFTPDSLAHTVNLHFFVPYSDTFTTNAFLTQGQGFGNYDVLIDSCRMGHFEGYSTNQYGPVDSVVLGTLYLVRGYHTLTFHYIGKDPLATDSELWADYLRLIPITPPAAATPVLPSHPMELEVFPNPASSWLYLRAPVPDSSPLSVSLVNTLGSVVQKFGFQVRSEDGICQIPVASLPSGIYWVRLSDANGIVTRAFQVLH